MKNEERIERGVGRLLAAKTLAEGREIGWGLAMTVGEGLSGGASAAARHRWEKAFEAALQSLRDEMFGDAKLSRPQLELCSLKEAYLCALEGVLLGLKDSAEVESS